MNQQLTERLTAALEALAIANNSQKPSRASIILREIAYIKEFDGDKNQLTQFIDTVGTHLSDITDVNTKREIWTGIYNNKITGRAKELLLNNNPTGWEEAKNLLKQYFRPACSYKEISRKISCIKVSSIYDLNFKIESLVKEINSFSTYEKDQKETKNTFYTLLINRIKQIVAGNLSREIKDMHDLHQIKEILYSYVGYDNQNLDREFTIQDRRNVPNTRQDSNFSPRNFNNVQNNYRYNNRQHSFVRPDSGNYRQNYTQQNSFRPQNQTSGQYRQNFAQNNFRTGQNQSSGQFRQPVFNISGQFRNATQQLEPMEVGQISHLGQAEETQYEEVHNIEPKFFLN